jgi:hypothetical protein
MSEREPLDTNGRAVKLARVWLKRLRAEAEARYQYQTADEPRAKERARKRWLHERDEWAKLKIPSDDAIRIAKEH